MGYVQKRSEKFYLDKSKDEYIVLFKGYNDDPVDGNIHYLFEYYYEGRIEGDSFIAERKLNDKLYKFGAKINSALNLNDLIYGIIKFAMDTYEVHIDRNDIIDFVEF